MLSECEVGKKATLSHIHGGRRMRSRLYSLGLLPGTQLVLLSRGGKGPVMITVNGSRLAIGRGMAEKIEVAPGKGSFFLDTNIDSPNFRLIG
jgi:Fe2+ transport system protein FeoA